MIVAFLSSLNLPSQHLLSLGDEPFVDGKVPLATGMMTISIQDCSWLGWHDPKHRPMKFLQNLFPSLVVVETRIERHV